MSEDSIKFIDQQIKEKSEYINGLWNKLRIEKDEDQKNKILKEIESKNNEVFQLGDYCRLYRKLLQK